MYEYIAVNAIQADALGTDHALTLIQFRHVNRLGFTAGEASNHILSAIAQEQNTALADIPRAKQVHLDPVVVAIFTRLLGCGLLAAHCILAGCRRREELAKRDEVLNAEKGTVLLACAGELGRADEKDATDAAMGGKFAARRGATGTHVELVLGLAVARTDLGVLYLLRWEAQLDHRALLHDLDFSAFVGLCVCCDLVGNQKAFHEVLQVVLASRQAKLALGLRCQVLEDEDFGREAHYAHFDFELD